MLLSTILILVTMLHNMDDTKGSPMAMTTPWPKGNVKLHITTLLMIKN